MIEWLGDILQRNLVFFVALSVLPLKWLICRICRDRESEAAAILAVPEDICYVSLGLVLGDLINAKGAFRNYYSDSAHRSINICIVVAIMLAAVTAIHQLFRATVRHYKGWTAAKSTRSKYLLAVADGTEGVQGVRDSARDQNYMMLMLRHLLLFSSAYAAQFAIALQIVHYVGRVIAGNH
jgi:hypothetical protein